MSKRRNIALCALWVACVLSSGASFSLLAADGKSAHQVGQRFARALEAADSGMLGSMLPDEGKVRLRLRRLGPEDGSFSARQVRSLFRDFFKGGSIGKAECEHADEESGAYALARLTLDGRDREGRPLNVRLHLGFQWEDDRWALREIRETPP